MFKETLKPGDLEVFEVEIDGERISDHVLVCNIYQDIFNPTWSAKLTISDSDNIIMQLPITPGSEVEIKVGNKPLGIENEDKTYKFVVYKIDDNVVIKGNHQMYVVHLTQKIQLEDFKTRISRAFVAKPVSDIVTIVMDELGAKVQAHNSVNVYSLITPNMSPLSIATWMCKFALSDDEAADYTFFQSDDEEFRFWSLEKMFTDEDSKLKLYQRQQNRSADYEDGDFLNIEGFKIMHFDSITNMSTGYYGNSTVTHDILNKTIENHEYEYGQDTSKDKTLKPFNSDIFDATANSNKTFYPKHTEILDSGDTPGFDSEIWSGSRRSNVIKMDQIRTTVMIPGFSSSYKHIGKKVEIDIPSHQETTDDQLNKYLKGDFVVTAMNHEITKGEYLIIAELSKKRLDTPL